MKFCKLLSKVKTKWEIFSNFCGLLKISELYKFDQKYLVITLVDLQNVFIPLRDGWFVKKLNFLCALIFSEIVSFRQRTETFLMAESWFLLDPNPKCSLDKRSAIENLLNKINFALKKKSSQATLRDPWNKKGIFLRRGY